MPLSITPTLTPLPVPPAFHAWMAPDVTAAFERRYSASS
jgi:hypothetical protein